MTSDDLTARVLAAIEANTATLEALRADLKRREARDLEHAGRIPPAHSAGTRAVLGEGQGSLDGTGPVFPPYGKSQGRPIAGASAGDLDFYRNGCLRTLNDPAKSRWHGKEEALLAAINAEIARQKGGASTGAQSPAPDFGPGDDNDVPFVTCAGIR